MLKSLPEYILCLSLLAVLMLLPVTSALGACEQKVSLRVVRLLQKIDQNMSAQPLVAQQLIESFQQKYPDHQHYLIDYHLGNLYGQSGQLLKALAAYDAALIGCDQEAGLWQNRGKIAWDLKQYTVAADSLFRAYELGLQKEPALLFHTAVARMYAGQKKAALLLLETLLDATGEAPQDAWLETYVNLSLELNKADQAQKRLQASRLHLESRKVFWRLLAMLQVQQKEYEKGAASLQILAAFEPLNKTDKKLLADLLLQVNIPLEAVKLYAELLAENPADRKLNEQVITCYRLGLRPQKALAAVDHALAVYSSGKLLKHRGEILFETGQYQQAFQVFDQLLLLKSNQGLAYLYQGYCALRMEDRVLARKVLTRAVQFKKEKREAERLLAWLRRT